MEKQMIGPFRLEKELGAGGMGIVYLATYVKTKQQVALKVLPPALSANDKLVARFEREMEILKRLKHPNVVPYYGGWKHAGQHFYAMKFMAGGSVEDILKKKGRIPWKDTIAYARQVCKALEYAHKFGVVHRDLKPANLFLTKEERLCLGDFGIARDMDATALTAAGFTVGTCAYMAPEQITGQAAITPKTDLYALGCVLFEMLTGQTPYQGENQAEVLFKHVQSEIPRVSQVVDDCPDLLEDVVTRLLQKPPDDRPHDAAFADYLLKETEKKVTAAIRSNEASQTIKDVHPGLTTLIEKKKRKKKKRKDDSPFYERTWFLVACLFLLVGGVVWSMWPASEQELFRQAQVLMETDDPVQWQEAKDRYLAPLLERFPEGEHADQARTYLEEIEMHRAERRAFTNARLGREPESEAERLFVEAWRFEQFGDRVTAVEKYRSLSELLKGRQDARAYVALARRHAAAIEAQDTETGDRVELVNQALERADQLFEDGQVLEARKIWNSIVTLYASNLEFEPQVKRARARLSGQDSDSDGKPESNPADSR